MKTLKQQLAAKDKKLRKANQRIKYLREVMETYAHELHYLQDQVSNNYRIRKLIVGMHGTGKTTYIKEQILPKLKNYVLVDVNFEYKEYTGGYKLIFSEDENKYQRLKRILQSMNDHRNKVFIIDDAGWIISDNTLKWQFFTHISNNKIDVILAAQDLNKFDRLEDYFDYIYAFPLLSKIEPKLFENTRHKILHLPKLKPSIF